MPEPCTSKPTGSSASPGTPGTFDPEAIFRHQLQRLTELAQNPGWKAYAWHRAKELDAEPSGLFKGMADALKAAMTGRAKDGAPDSQTPTKHP